MAKQSLLNIAADADLLFEILTGYDALAEWLPFVARSRLLAREGDLALAELELRDEQKTRCVIECIHSPRTLVVWRPVDDAVSVVELRWELSPAPEGGLSVSAAADKPRSLSSAISARFLDPEGCLEALKSQAGLFSPGDHLAEGCEKVLEIIETSAGLVCWLRGKKYRMVPDSQ